MTKALANEWSSKGVNVNAIAPDIWDRNEYPAMEDPPVINSFWIASRLDAGVYQRIWWSSDFLSSPPPTTCTGLSYPLMVGSWHAETG